MTLVSIKYQAELNSEQQWMYVEVVSNNPIYASIVNIISAKTTK